MTIHELAAARSAPVGTLGPAIFGVDGVLLASPHEQAWHAAFQRLADPDRFTKAMYQGQVVSKPRPGGVASGAMAGLSVARHSYAAALLKAGTRLVETSLHHVVVGELADGRLCGRPS